MRVLEGGKPLQLICTGEGNGGNGCKALLEVEYTDLRYWSGSSGHGGWGESDPAVCFKCMVCGAVTDIPRARWPQVTSQLTKATSAWIHGGRRYQDVDRDPK